MVKAVLDTNVFVSAIIFPGGAPDLVFKAAIRKQYEMIICPFILSELRKVLKEKFYYTEEEALRVTEFIRSISSCIVKLEVCPTLITAKPSDNHTLACAVEGDADYLVSGDTKHIQPLGAIGNTEIISPAEFMHVLARPKK